MISGRERHGGHSASFLPDDSGTTCLLPPTPFHGVHRPEDPTPGPCPGARAGANSPAPLLCALKDPAPGRDEPSSQDAHMPTLLCEAPSHWVKKRPSSYQPQGWALGALALWPQPPTPGRPEQPLGRLCENEASTVSQTLRNTTHGAPKAPAGEKLSSPPAEDRGGGQLALSRP